VPLKTDADMRVPGVVHRLTKDGVDPIAAGIGCTSTHGPTPGSYCAGSHNFDYLLTK
jgi:hypothetical protein